MPVSCKLINGKYRLVKKDGSIETNSKGNAVDGGGHSTEKACQAQMRAINMNSLAISYIVASVDTEQTGPLTFRKELIYVGEFEKKDEYQFSVNSATLEHWKHTFDEMKQVGVEVPVHIEHTTDPEKRRGTVVDMELGTNSRGLPAIFGIIEFGNAEYAKLADTAQVSIFVPPEAPDGKGNTYVQPIRAVALTDYPVIPKLDGFESIAASLVPFDNGEKKMALSQFAKSLNDRLGWECEDDTALETAVLEMSIRAKLAEEEKEKEAPSGGGEGGEGEEDKEKEKEMSKSPPAVAASMVKMLKENRTMKIDGLIKAGKVTKAVGDKLKEQHCKDENLTVALSSDSDDGFDGLIETLSLNASVVNTEDKTPGQVLSLSSDKNPLIKNAEERAKRNTRPGVRTGY